LSVALSLRSPSPELIRHRSSVEPGLSSRAAFRRLRMRPPGRLALRIKGLARQNARPDDSAGSALDDALHLLAIGTRNRVHALRGMAGIVLEDRVADRSVAAFTGQSEIFHPVLDVRFGVEQALDGAR